MTGAPPTPAVGLAPVQNEASRAVDDDRHPRDQVLVPDDGHFPMYEADMDLVHMNPPEERPRSSDTRRGPWRLRDAYLTEHHVELYEARTIFQTESHEGEYMWE